jgi:hypothetical protein
MLCTVVFYSKRLTNYYPDYLVHNVVIIIIITLKAAIIYVWVLT